MSAQQVEEAETRFLTALDIARWQQAKAWELRATRSLARLWQSQGKLREVRTLLEDIYDWFTEGFDTKDLQEVATLLRSLGSENEDQKTKSRKQKVEQAEGSSLFSLPNRQPTAPYFSQSSALNPRPLASPSNQQLITNSIAPSPTSLPQDSTPPTSDTFRCEGEYGTLAFDGKICRVRDMRGLHYLAYLLQHPNDDIHAFRLVTGDETNADARHSNARPPAADELSVSASDSGELLDAQARAAHKQRIADLQAELDEALTFHDQGRSDKLREELEFLTHELAQAVGLGGRVPCRLPC